MWSAVRNMRKQTMNYKGYTIEHQKGGYYLVTDGSNSWTEDTVQDAKYTIDDITKEEQNNELELERRTRGKAVRH